VHYTTPRRSTLIICSRYATSGQTACSSPTGSCRLFRSLSQRKVSLALCLSRFFCSALSVMRQQAASNL